MNYETEITIPSRAVPGVSFTLARVSFGRRMELLRRLRDLASKAECLSAGGKPQEKLEAALLSGEIDELYLRWGLVRVSGLEVDGQPATPETLIAAGPEEVCREAVAAIKHECGLTEEERKN
jgi:hypothetical protein